MTRSSRRTRRILQMASVSTAALLALTSCSSDDDSSASGSDSSPTASGSDELSGEVIVFAASPRASFMTGAVLSVDGGATAGKRV